MNEPETTAISQAFVTFLNPETDRLAFLSAWLYSRNIEHKIVELAGKNHLVIRFASAAYDSKFKQKTLIAHYDRAQDSPGANDNSAACFQLLLLAERLNRVQVSHNITVVLTDGEEAAGSQGVASQGAYGLGTGMRALGLTDTDVYVLDGCGRGDTLIISDTGTEETLPQKMLRHIEQIYSEAAISAREAANNNWMRIPTPWSDNAGLLAAGIASLVVTVLPYKEAVTLKQALNSDPVTEAQLKQLLKTNPRGCARPELVQVIPRTWLMMHTDEDTAGSLQAGAFMLMARFLDALARRMTVKHA